MLDQQGNGHDNRMMVGFRRYKNLLPQPRHQTYPEGYRVALERMVDEPYAEITAWRSWDGNER